MLDGPLSRGGQFGDLVVDSKGLRSWKNRKEDSGRD